MDLIKITLKKINNFLVLKSVIIIFMIACISLLIAGICMRFGMDIQILEDATLIGKPIDSNIALLWLVFLIFISNYNLKQIKKSK